MVNLTTDVLRIITIHVPLRKVCFTFIPCPSIHPRIPKNIYHMLCLLPLDRKEEAEVVHRQNFRNGRNFLPHISPKSLLDYSLLPSLDLPIRIYSPLPSLPPPPQPIFLK